MWLGTVSKTALLNCHCPWIENQCWVGLHIHAASVLLHLFSVAMAQRKCGHSQLLAFLVPSTLSALPTKVMDIMRTFTVSLHWGYHTSKVKLTKPLKFSAHRLKTINFLLFTYSLITYVLTESTVLPICSYRAAHVIWKISKVFYFHKINILKFVDKS